MKYIPILFLFCGCVSWETIGITSTRSFNKFVGEAENLKNDMLKPTERLGEAVLDNAREHMYEAKKEKDMAKVERVAATAQKARTAVENLKELEKRTFTRAEAPPFDWGALIQSVITALMGALGIGGPMGLMMMSKLNKVKAKAREYAASTEVNQVDKDIA